MAHRGIPHSPILNYTSDAISSAAQSAAGKLNLCRDLSATNRQHWPQTTSKGVPLVYTVALTFSPQTADGSDASAYLEVFTGDANMLQRVQVNTAPNNWVMRNGSVKTHAAREMMFRKTGIRKKDRGAYSKTIHYTWSAGVDTFLTPKDGDGNAYTGGSWEYSKLIFGDDSDGSYIKLMGTHATEESATSFSTLSLPQMYLSSRNQVEADTNTDVADQPAAFSVLRELLMSGGVVSLQDEITDEARDIQDEPPYDLAEDGDWTEPVNSAVVFLGVSSGLQQTVIVDVPFGMLELKGQNCFLDAGWNATNPVEIRAEVIAVRPMGEY